MDHSRLRHFETIVGAGSWWPDAKEAELARRCRWHTSGSPDGRWVAADNFHGDIVILEDRTTEEKPLTGDHRTYGGGLRAHVGWAPSSDRVIFGSHKRGSHDVVISHLPPTWR